MEIRKILWLEDQNEDYSAFRSVLFRSGYLVDYVKSVSDAVKKIRGNNYIAYIFDIKVLPGGDNDWIEIDKKKRTDNPDSYLGLELLYTLFNSPKAHVKLHPPVKIDPKKVIVFSVVYDKTEEISSLGIPGYQILYKSSSDSKTLLQVIESVQSRSEGK